MSTSLPLDLSSAVPCHRCGYDVRAQPADGACPECRAAVDESRRMSLIPYRPAWRDSDPRWRRRMLAGVWALVFLPLVAVLQAFPSALNLPAPIFFRVQANQTLGGTYVITVYEYLMFCIGVVLLFSKERGRQRGPFDWTQRWGVVASYGVLLLGFAEHAFIVALVLIGIAAMGLSMPRGYAPAVTPLFAKIGTGYIWYGPTPSRLSDASLTACSAIVVLLACAPLYNALRSSGPRAAAAIVLAPLAFSAVWQLVEASLYAALLIGPQSAFVHAYYFDPRSLAKFLTLSGWPFIPFELIVEGAKWFACLAIAVWLSVAQIAAMSVRQARQR